MGLPLLMAILAAGGVLLVIWALLGAQSSDPVQARLTQLGSLEGARSLEELELRAPFFDRTMRPLMRRLSGVGARLTSRERIGRTESPPRVRPATPTGCGRSTSSASRSSWPWRDRGLLFLVFGVALGEREHGLHPRCSAA